MSRIRMMFAALIVGGLGWAVHSAAFTESTGAQEKKGPNVQETPKDVKTNPKTKALQDLELAAKLIAFGREHKNAESLLLAAKIIHTTPTDELKADTNAVKGEATKAKAAKQKDNSPKALIAEAKAMSSAPHIGALVAATEKIVDEASRGPVGGPYRVIQNVGPGQVWTISGLRFVGGQIAQVDVDLAGVPGRFILTIHDEFGNLIARDAVPGTFYNCRWLPLFTGTYTIRLTNIDSLIFRCDLLAN